MPGAARSPIPAKERSAGAAGVHEARTLAGAAVGDLAPTFEENRGQVDPSVRYLTRGGGATVFLTGGGAVFRLVSGDAGAAVELRPAGAGDPVLSAERSLAGRVSYLVGSDPDGWHANIPTWGAVRYRGLWPGTDLLFYGRDDGALEYDLELAPGADPGAIAFRARGADDLRITTGGDLVIETAAGPLTQRAPVIYQETAAGRRPVRGAFRVDAGRIGFRVGRYDPALPLVIDPVVELDHSSFLGGGAADNGRDVEVDASGAAFVAGYTESADFPTTPGAFDTTDGASTHAFVTKVNPEGNALEFSTYLGGSGDDLGFGLAVPPTGTPFVVGRTNSADFPTTPGAFDTTLNPPNDAFVSQLNATGTGLVASSYLGGNDVDEALGVVLDDSGAVYVFGDADSADFPTTGGAFDPTHNSPGSEDVFVTKLSSTLAGLVYSTFLGGSARDFGGENGIAIDPTGAAYLVGHALSADFPTTPGAYDTTNSGGDIFVAKLNPAGSGLVYSTFLAEDDGEGVAVDASGSAYVTGEADPGFPTTPGAYDETVDGSADGYITKLNPQGSALVYSTVIGGSGFEDVESSVVLDASGRASIAGQTSSTDFPATPGAHDATYNGGTDAFAATVSATGDALVHSTFLGGGAFDVADDIAVDPFGRLYVTGSTSSVDFPTASFDTTYNGGTDAFVSRLAPKCPGREGLLGIHIVGSDADEELVGSPSRDVICGEGGRDVLRGLGGPDTILGDAGADRLVGGKGRDLLRGGRGRDTALGQAGRDRVAGQAGNDVLKGGKGKGDGLRGGKGRDTLNGGPGKKDRCSGGPGKDRGGRGCELGRL